MNKIEMSILALTHSVANHQNYALVLSEIGGNRRLPIIIGQSEANSMIMAIEGMKPPRPLTHDLFINSFEAFQIQIQEVIIYSLTEGVFYAHLVCNQNGNILQIDSRTSDALALALRVRCPIYTFDTILETAGIVFEEEESEHPSITAAGAPATDSPISSYSTDALSKMLQEALGKEDYEQAAVIRDELNKRR